MKPTLDWSEAPLLVATFYSTITAAEVRAHFREMEEAIHELGRAVVVVDLSDAPLYSGSLVQIAGDEMKAGLARFGPKIMAVAHVIPTAPARALMAAVQWLAPPPFPSLVTASHEEARTWVRSHLDRATPVPMPAPPARRDARTLVNVREAIGRALYDATPTIGAIGRRLGMSGRTLQRRLNERGVTFNQMLDSVRRDAALVAIKRPGASVHDVAVSCGFDDVKSLRRAFRRWTGRSPSEYRKLQT